MSFIRSLNNPEGLYVWNDINSNTYFCVGDDMSFFMPTSHFERIMKKCRKEWHEGDPGEKITSGRVVSLEEVGPNGKKGYGKVRLTYNGKSITMWGVTFYYIYSNWLDRQ